MDHEGCCIVCRSLLQVDDDDFASVWNAAKRHLTGWVDSHAGAHAEAQIGLGTLIEAKLEDVFSQVLSEVDDGVSKSASTSWSVTDATSLVSVALLSCSHSVVAHVLAIALITDLKVGIAMDVSKLVWVNATFPVKSVDILADDCLKDVSVHKLNESHMRG